MENLKDLSRDDLLKLIDIHAKSWLAHDGCWFLAIEEKHGLEEAIAIDTKSWERFSPAATGAAYSPSTTPSRAHWRIPRSRSIRSPHSPLASSGTWFGDSRTPGPIPIRTLCPNRRNSAVGLLTDSRQTLSSA